MFAELRPQSVRRFDFSRRFDIEDLPEEDQAKVFEQEEAEREEAERLEAEREAVRVVAKAEGYEAGRQAAREEFSADVARIGQVLVERIEESFAAVEAFQEAVTRDAIELALAIGEGLAGEAYAQRPTASIEQAVATAMKEQAGQPVMVVKVAPSDLAAVDAIVRDQAQLVKYEGRISVQAGESLQDGDCSIEWSNGGIRALRAERRARVVGEIAELLKVSAPEE